MNVNGVEWTAEPRIPYRAVDYINSLSLTRVFEWGSGGSTIFFKEMSVSYLDTVDHSAKWQNAVKAEFQRRGIGGVRWHLFPYEPGDIGPDKANPDHYKSGSTEIGPANFKKYASYIDQCGKFDLILVDGHARPSCLKHAASHVKPGGCLVLDNTDREYYLQHTLSLFEGWERVDFYGYGPILAYPWRCTIFHNTRKVDHES